MRSLQRTALWLGLISFVIVILSLLLNIEEVRSPLTVIGAVLIAYGIGSVEALKSYRYTVWIIVAIVCGIIYPSAFLKWGDLDLRNKWLILTVVQVVMFGMGTQMSLKDFTGIKTMGKGVLVGIIAQFSIMPLSAYMLTRVLNFEPEIAAGIILIGSCSSGLASNVMVYLAKANLALSVTLTAVATLLAPIMTPFWMKMLAGTYVHVDFINMSMEIVKIVIVPIGAALLFDAYKHSSVRLRQKLNVGFFIATGWLIINVLGFWDFMSSHLSGDWMRFAEVLNYLCGAVVVGKLYYHLIQILPVVSSFMPKLSMFGIIYFTLVTTAASREYILSVGALVLLACIFHNSLGYTLGYWFSRALRLDEDSCRTVALEVGLQNGGMATGLAGVMGKLATVGLAAAIFSPWMNISGSILANYWRKKKEKGDLNTTSDN
ncbi:MAG TPA: bile acid:sodium symporter family protein [Paludibacter sp.]|nr:bile acid:sodium symporter family protein [Paludibacter sp.]